MILLIPALVLLGAGLGLQVGPDGGVSRALRLPAALGQEGVELVPRDGEEPGPETVGLGTVIEAANSPGDRPHDFLGHIGGIRLLQAAAATEIKDQRGVEVDELLPGVRVVGVAYAQQQTWPSVGRGLHGALERSCKKLSQIPAGIEAQNPRGAWE